MGLKNLFQATVLMDTQDSCLGWYSWFKERGVPVAVIKTNRGYAVYRNMEGSVEPDFKEKYEILVPCNGFSLSEKREPAPCK